MLLLTAFKELFISFINDSDNKKLLNASEDATTATNPMHKNATHSEIKATVYAIGSFVSNGKLLHEKKIFDINDQWEIVKFLVFM